MTSYAYLTYHVRVKVACGNGCIERSKASSHRFITRTSVADSQRDRLVLRLVLQYFSLSVFLGNVNNHRKLIHNAERVLQLLTRANREGPPLHTNSSVESLCSALSALPFLKRSIPAPCTSDRTLKRTPTDTIRRRKTCHIP
jgi:hypothetical protein